MSPISGQSVIILGGSSGVGFAVARLCLADNVRVAIASSSQSKVDSAVERLCEACSSCEGKPKGYVIDLSNADVETDLEMILSDVTKQGAQPLDHIINTTTGRPDLRALEDVDLSFLAETAQVPTFVPILLGKLAPKYLRRGHTSSLIFTSGRLGERPVTGCSIMAAYAAGIHGFTRGLACDLAPLRVNCVAPGNTETELWGGCTGGATGKMAIDKPLLGQTSASPDQVAEAYMYLMRNTDATGSIVSGT